MKRIAQFVHAIVWSPVLWGGLATVAFYAPLELGYWHSPFAQRYFAGHPVERVATALFLVGIAALVLRALQVNSQRAVVNEPLLGPTRERGQSVEQCDVHLARLARLPIHRQDNYLVRRLREGLQYVARKRSADTLDEHLRYLADLDVARMHASYSLVRIIIWAIPILGLLGTVIGITAAVANLSPESLQESVSNVTAGLGVAFDHTALALALSIGLMFSQFVVERGEQRLVAEVDDRTEAELVGRFAETAGGSDPNVVVVRRMAESMLGAAEQLVVRQTELWQATIAAAQHDWSHLAESAGEQLQTSLGAALAQSLAQHAQVLGAAEALVAERNAAHWAQVGQSLVDGAAAMIAQQRELVRQGEVLTQVVAATGQVARLEEGLNRNLASLAAAQHFDETMSSLSAAVHLLIARLAQVSPDAPSIVLPGAARSSKAA